MNIQKRHAATPGSLADINVTPFVDVMLVLLIIFMITAPILQSGIQVELPKTRTVQTIVEERLVVTIDRGQRVYLGNERVNVNALGSLLRGRITGERQTVYVRSDAAVPFGVFATVMDKLRQAGIDNLSVVTEPITTRGS